MKTFLLIIFAVVAWAVIAVGAAEAMHAYIVRGDGYDVWIPILAVLLAVIGTLVIPRKKGKP